MTALHRLVSEWRGIAKAQRDSADEDARDGYLTDADDSRNAAKIYERCAGDLEQAMGAGWISVKGRMPEIDKVVLVDGGIATWRGGHWDSLTGQIRAIEWDIHWWMPMPQLPAPPEAGDA